MTERPRVETPDDRRRRRQRATDVIGAVREQILLMETEKDLDGVLGRIGASLQEAGLRFTDCGINLIDPEEPRKVRFYDTGTRSWVEGGADRGADVVLQIWGSGSAAYRTDLQQKDVHGEASQIERDLGHAIRSVVDVPFSHGTLAVNSTEPDAFGADDIKIIELMAEALATGVARMHDLRHLQESNLKLADANQLLRNLHEISRLSASSLDRLQILDTLGRQLVGAGVLRSLSFSLVDQQVHRVIMVGSHQREPDGVGKFHEGTGVSLDLGDPDILAETARTGQL